MKTDCFKIRVSKTLLAQALCAKQTLAGTDVDVLAAARFFKEISEIGRTKKPERLKNIFRLGYDLAAKKRTTPSFKTAFGLFLASKSHLRERTQTDYRGVRSAIFKRFPTLAARQVVELDTTDCARIFADAFHTPRQRGKARAVLHAFFAFCVRRGWCRKNPVDATDAPRPKEREITPLTLGEIAAIFSAAKKLNLSECVPAIAMMLFAGVRPREVERLRWRDLDWEEKVISISPTHSKTGGSRHVSIPPVLEKILRRAGPGNAAAVAERPICPVNWHRKWTRIRRAAGWTFPENPWSQDVLRHTFASYHLKFFKNLPQLQCEMGHSSPRLLRTRYLSMRGLTFATAERFWRGEDASGRSLFDSE